MGRRGRRDEREVEGKGARDLCDCMNFMILLFVSQERLFSLRFIYDLTFFLIVIVIIFQNLIFGVIIDTFADLRAEKNKKEEQLKNECFICGEHDYITSTGFLLYHNNYAKWTCNVSSRLYTVNFSVINISLLEK